MKRFILLTLLLLIALPLYAEKSEIFTALQINQVTMGWTDFTITSIAAHRYNIKELNPIARLYIDKPLVSIPLNIGLTTMAYVASSILYNKNKTLAYIIIIAVNIARGYALYNNLREMAR